MNKMTVVKWYDPDTCDTVKLAAQAYGIQIKAAEPTGNPDEIFVCVYGPTENVDRFVDDVEEGDVEPFESKRELSDNEYQEWLADQLRTFGVLYIPTFIKEDIDED